MAFYSFFVLCIALLLSLSSLSFSSASSDVELLTDKIRPSLQGPSSSSSDSLLLFTWNSSVPVCQWRGLKWVFSDGSLVPCSPDAASSSSRHWSNSSLYSDPSLRFLSLELPSANLSGSLPRELGAFSMLRSIYIGINSIFGTVPLELGYASSLLEVDLSENLFGGVLPPSVWNLCDRLVSLSVHGNSLSGSLPKTALPNSTCRSLQVLDFGGNRFSREFPEFITLNAAGLQLGLRSP